MDNSKTSTKPHIFAVASIGGHWIQLLRIAEGLKEHFNITYCSTNPKCAAMVVGEDYFLTSDFSRWDAYKVFPSFIKFIGRFIKKRPKAVITTGAAPGLTALLAAKILGIKTIWIDSIANAEHLSFSGRIAKRFASRTYTQWEELSDRKTVYEGNVLK